MGKNKGIFKKIVVGVMTFTMCLGMVTPAFAKEDSKKTKHSYNADMVIAMDVSGSMSGSKLTKAKKSAKKMAESIWKEQGDYRINVRIGLVTFESSVVHHKNDGKDF